ncbi:hypothetical protein A9Q68_05475 [Streptococcus bovimastitidis]|uniref:MORN motif family protein n=1 Tax=Streptococcus bovimastitidis TaxID=1856638 RepID=A0A1L8MQU2_9STRE|nr:hypothetical protein [Streptococcus bovimastitidis]OJF73055.1 hypothetical protein A9Q68_05475 [Streptococcus bovimastitidis]
MENIRTFFKNIKITRVQLEIVTLIVLVVCGLSVLTLKHQSQAALSFDHGKIKYNGAVVNHRMNGKGKLVFANGDTYVGNFRDGQFNGQGTYKASSGWSYKGQFKKGQVDGKGTLNANNSKVYKGTFKQGIYQK